MDNIMENNSEYKYDCEYNIKYKNITIYFNILKDGRSGIDILNGYEINDDCDKMMFLNAITNYCQYGIDFGKRSIYSLFTEWKAHNILYKKGIFKKRTKGTGLDKNERWYRRLFYRFVCFIFTEK